MLGFSLDWMFSGSRSKIESHEYNPEREKIQGLLDPFCVLDNIIVFLCVQIRLQSHLDFCLDLSGPRFLSCLLSMFCEIVYVQQENTKV